MRVLSVFVLAVLVVPAPGFAQNAKAGDTMTVSAESTLHLDVVVRDGKGETTNQLQLVRKEKFAQEVLEAAGGKPTSVRVQCVASTLQKSGSNIQLEVAPTALAGKTYVSTLSGGNWVVKGADGGATPAGGETLGGWNAVTALLPAGGPPQQGAQWTVEGAVLSSLVYPSGLKEKESAGQLACTCASVADGKATITFTGQVSGKAMNEAVVVLAVRKGVLVYDLAKGRPVSLTVSGAVSTSLDIVDRYRKPNDPTEEEVRKIGEINTRSRRMEATFSFE